ncbi:MAG: hypothetical protein ACOZEN_11900 [Thermodesulfobacteriota bacterium]
MDAQTDQELFTEKGYADLLRTAKTGWRFISYPEWDTPGRAVLWRHDVDASMHRALALASIEARENVRATYFLYPHGMFYNLLETRVVRIVARIAEMGHHIGLHFDPGHYSLSPLDARLREELLLFERRLIERSFGVSVQAFSVHNPSSGWLASLGEREEAGMMNAYHPDLLGGVFRYVSDSNGYWRFQSLGEVLADGREEKLHVLTHPEWWTPGPMPPRGRLERAVRGRAKNCMADYDALLARHGRRNVR